MKESVLIVPHSHNDPGWKHTMERYYEMSVRNTLDLVLHELQCDGEMRFTWADVAFLHRWWRERHNETVTHRCAHDVDADDGSLQQTYADLVRSVLARGQLDLVHGAFVQHDEAATSLYAAVTQIMLGHRWIDAHVQRGLRVRTAFQIDPFGHSAAMPSLFLMAGQTRAVINRIDFRLKRERAEQRRLEFHWFSAHENASMFVHVLRVHYSQPKDRNLTRYVDQVLAPAYRAPSSMLIFGDDFRYAQPSEFSALRDTVLAFNADSPRRHMQLSTVSHYLDVAEPLVDRAATLERDLDFFPYREAYIDVWTGFYASRPALKAAIRDAERWLRAAELFDARPEARLDEARVHVSILQHHDAITGTCTQDAADDYLRMASAAKAAAVDLLGGDAAAEAAAHSYLVVNSLPWRRTELLQLVVPFEHAAVDAAVSIPCQTVPAGDGELLLLLARVELDAFESVRLSVRRSELGAAGACEPTPFVSSPARADSVCHGGVCADLSVTRYYSKYFVPLSSGAYVFRTELRLPQLVGVLGGALLLAAILAITPIWRATVCRWRRGTPSRAHLWLAGLVAALAVPRFFWLGDGPMRPSATSDVALANDIMSVAIATASTGFAVTALAGVNGRCVVPVMAVVSVLCLAALMHTCGSELGERVRWQAGAQVARGGVATVRALSLRDGSRATLVEPRHVGGRVDVHYRFAPLPPNSELMVRAVPSFGAQRFATDHQLGLIAREPFTWHWLQPLSMAFKPLIGAAELVGARAEQHLSLFTRRACGAALLGNALELHVGRRMLTDDEKGLRDGVDDRSALDVDVRMLVGAATPLERAREAVLFDQPLLLVRGAAAPSPVEQTPPPLARAAWPAWAHLLMYRALRDNATVAGAAAAADDDDGGGEWSVLHVQNVDERAHECRVDELVAWGDAGVVRCSVVQLTGLEQRGAAACEAASVVRLRARQVLSLAVRRRRRE
jgi:hypothetical protein